MEAGLPLILRAAPRLVADPSDNQVREELGLATDLGAYAIMIGGTNGPHLTSFSLVNLASHGRACAILGPYYAAFFAPAITTQLQLVGEILARHGHLEPAGLGLTGRSWAWRWPRGCSASSSPWGIPRAWENCRALTPHILSKLCRRRQIHSLP